MIYQYDQALQLPTVDLYDTQIMAMALNAAKDMYEKGEQQIKDFQKAYGDFLTPITADQNWWNANVTGKVRDTINEMYARGGDPLRNAQDRAKLSMMINNMPYGDMAFKRQRAENAKEYYKAAGALAAQNKYDKDFAMFLGEDPNQWAPDFMGITAPTQFQTLKEATNDWYNNRSLRDLTPEEIKAYGGDPRYSYKGFLDNDLMNIARNQTPGWQGTPQARYYRELAKRQLQAAGVSDPTTKQVEAVLQRNIADAQQEWLAQPIKGEADRFKVLAAQDAYNRANIILQDKLAGDRDAKNHAYKMAEIAARYGTPGSKGGASGNTKMSDVFKYGEATQDQAIGRIVQSLLGTVDKLGENGLPVVDKDGKRTTLNINDATINDVRYAYAYRVLPAYLKYMKDLRAKYPNGSKSAPDDKAVFGSKAFSEYLNTFGYQDSDTGFKASMGVDSKTNVPFSAGDIDRVFTDAEVMAMAKGYNRISKDHDHKAELTRVLERRKTGGQEWNSSMLYGNNANGIIEPLKAGPNSPNKIPVILDDGSMIMLRAVNIKYGNSTNTYNTGRLWIPVGSPTLPQTMKGNKIAALNPYTDDVQSMRQIDENAKYQQAMGGQKNQNIGLSLSTDDIANMSDEELDALIEQYKTLGIQF